jgi:hypothetical protein
MRLTHNPGAPAYQPACWAHMQGVTVGHVQRASSLPRETPTVDRSEIEEGQLSEQGYE